MTFDPLHKWLGIPPDEQPPNHYRLLGVALFESDPDVIDAAADKQLSFLHDLTDGEFAAAAEEISNQVSMARLCLLNDKKRSVYDDSIRRNSNPHDSVETSFPETGPAQSPTPVPRTVESNAPVRVRSKRTKSRSRRRVFSASVLSSLSGLMILLGLGVAISQGHLKLDTSRLSWLFPDSTPTDSVSPRVSPAIRDSSALPSGALQNRDRRQNQSVSRRNRPLKTSLPESTSPGNSSLPNATMASSSAMTSGRSGKTLTPKRRRTLPELLHPKSDAQSSAKTNAIARVPKPTELEVAEKTSLVKEIYQKQIRAAKTREHRIELARQLFRDGERTSDDSGGQFALWEISRRIFAGEGELADASVIVDHLATHFQDIDVCQFKLQTLQESSANIDPDDLDDSFEASMGLATKCSELGRLEIAESVTEYVLDAFASGLRPSQIEKANQVRDSAVALGKRYGEFREAITTLHQSPNQHGNDAALHQIAGRYLGLVRNDWDEAIHFLAKSESSEMQAAAILELAHQNSAASSMAVADAWHVASQSIEKPEDRLRLCQHALPFYEAAVSETEGLVKRKAEKQVSELLAMLPKTLDDGSSQESLDRGSQMPSKVIEYRVLDSRKVQNFAKRQGVSKFEVGMGEWAAGGRGEVAYGVELRGVALVGVKGSASHPKMLRVDAFSKTGFFVDYRTPGGYTKRVFLAFELWPSREFTDNPAWGKGGKPDLVVDIGKSDQYLIDLTRWAPSTWDRRCWITLYMQNAGVRRSIEAKLQW